ERAVRDPREHALLMPAGEAELEGAREGPPRTPAEQLAELQAIIDLPPAELDLDANRRASERFARARLAADAFRYGLRRSKDDEAADPARLRRDQLRDRAAPTLEESERRELEASPWARIPDRGEEAAAS